MNTDDLMTMLANLPLLGREAEQEKLTSALQAGQLCVLTGPSGRGKTHLLRHVLKATELDRPVHTFSALAWSSEAVARARLAQAFQPPAPTWDALEQRLRAAAPLALVIDDVEALLGQDWSASFLERVSSLPARTEGAVSVLLAGRAGLAHFAQQRMPEAHLPLGPLHEDVVLPLMGAAAARLSDEQRETLLSISQRSPALAALWEASFLHLEPSSALLQLLTPNIYSKLSSMFGPPDAALRATAEALYVRVGRFWQHGGNDHFLAPYPVVFARQSPPTGLDMVALESALSQRQHSRAALAYRGELPADIECALNRLRASGHPIMPLPESWMQAALADEHPSGLLRAHERRYFEGYNLFFQSNSITDQGLFFGRVGLLNAIGGALGRQDSVLVTGQRKIGKTSTLHMLRQQLAGGPWCWIDFQSLAPDEDWRRFVFAEIIRAVDRWGEGTPSGGVPWSLPPSAPETVSALRAAMAPRLERMAQRGVPRQVFLVLDEIERILPTARHPERARPFVDVTAPLRALAQGPERWLTIIAADLRPTVNRVNLLPNGETNPLYRFFQEQPLPLFSQQETEHMIASIAALMGADVSAGVAETIHEHTGGHPYLSRVLAGHAFDARAGNPLDRGALERGMAEADRRWELGDFFAQNVWAMLTADEQALVLHVAQSGQPAAQPPKKLAMPRGRWRRAVRDLQDQGILDRGGKLAVASFIEWLGDEGLLQQTA